MSKSRKRIYEKSDLIARIKSHGTIPKYMIERYVGQTVDNIVAPKKNRKDTYNGIDEFNKQLDTLIGIISIVKNQQKAKLGFATLECLLNDDRVAQWKHGYLERIGLALEKELVSKLVNLFIDDKVFLHRVLAKNGDDDRMQETIEHHGAISESMWFKIFRDFYSTTTTKHISQSSYQDFINAFDGAQASIIVHSAFLRCLMYDYKKAIDIATEDDDKFLILLDRLNWIFDRCRSYSHYHTFPYSEQFEIYHYNKDGFYCSNSNNPNITKISFPTDFGEFFKKNKEDIMSYLYKTILEKTTSTQISFKLGEDESTLVSKIMCNYMSQTMETKQTNHYGNDYKILYMKRVLSDSLNEHFRMSRYDNVEVKIDDHEIHITMKKKEEGEHNE